MKYTTEEALAEIMRRRDQITLRRNRRACRVLSGAVWALFTALVMVIVLFQEKAASISAGTLYGSFLLSPEAGGYVLVSVIAFALGVCVTLLCLRYRNSKNGADNENRGAALKK